MRRIIIVFLFLQTICYSQDFAQIDEKVTQYPRYTQVEDLTTRIENDFSNDLDKTRAGFVWLEKNFRYNLAEFYNPKQRSYQFSYRNEAEKKQKLQALKDRLVDKAFLTKKGVCEEYAQSLKKIYDLLHLESEVITGYVRNSANEINRIRNRTNHAWNAVRINEKWMMIDATWAAGYEINGQWKRDFNDYFFDIPKDMLFKTHLPENSLWMLRFGRMSLQEFYQQPIYSNHFLKSTLELVQPQTGIISANGSEPIQVSFKNLSQPIYYHFSGSKYIKKASVIQRGSLQIINIPNPNRNALLSLFVNQREILQFQVRH